MCSLFDSSAGTVGSRNVTWDGVDGDGGTLGFGLGGIDLTMSGELFGFTMRMGVDANGANARMRMYQNNATTFSEVTVPIPVTGGAATQWVFVRVFELRRPLGRNRRRRDSTLSRHRQSFRRWSN